MHSTQNAKMRLIAYGDEGTPWTINWKSPASYYTSNTGNGGSCPMKTPKMDKCAMLYLNKNIHIHPQSIINSERKNDRLERVVTLVGQRTLALYPSLRRKFPWAPNPRKLQNKKEQNSDDVSGRSAHIS